MDKLREEFGQNDWIEELLFNIWTIKYLDKVVQTFVKNDFNWLSEEEVKFYWNISEWIKEEKKHHSYKAKKFKVSRDERMILKGATEEDELIKSIVEMSLRGLFEDLLRVSGREWHMLNASDYDDRFCKVDAIWNFAWMWDFGIDFAVSNSKKYVRNKTKEKKLSHPREYNTARWYPRWRPMPRFTISVPPAIMKRFLPMYLEQIWTRDRPEDWELINMRLEGEDFNLFEKWEIFALLNKARENVDAEIIMDSLIDYFSSHAYTTVDNIQ